MIQKIIQFFHACPEKVKIVEKEVPVWPRNFVSIDRGMLKEARDMEESELKAHRADISKIYDIRAFHREIESMVDQQVYFLAEKALGEEQFSFGRGAINGMRLVQERFKDLHSKHLDSKKPDEPFNPFEILNK